MKIGYIRVSKADGSQNFDLQIDSLIKSGVTKENIYHDKVSGMKEERVGLNNCLKALRKGDTLIVWKLDRLGRNLKHLVNIVQELTNKNIGFKVLTGQGANIDTTTANGKLIFGIFAALAEFERELIRERTIAGLKSARARGRKGGRKFQLTKSKVRLAQIAMKNKETKISELCKELGGITKQTLYRYVAPNGELRNYGKRILEG
ncbi:recombinase family protein [Pseudomonadota bacterium]